MSLYFATVDVWVSERQIDRPECVKLHFLMESQFGHEARDAERIAEANAPFGKWLHGVEFRECHTVQLPARVHSRPVKGAER